jgi:16S rRNA (adenine1518-N6/adenine1519-N6)-dimethyltransferase
MVEVCGTVRPRKRFGQHFLCDPLVSEKLLDWIAPKAADHLVEIGPGTGAFTRCLARARPASLTLIEIDRTLAEGLRKTYLTSGLGGNANTMSERCTGLPDAAVGRPAVSLIEGDALSVDYTALAATRGAPLRVVGNLPYNIASPLLLRLAGHRGALRDQIFMLQKEVVDRIVAPAGSSAFGRLTVMLQSCYDADWLFDVEPESFDPPPRVRSAVVRLRGRRSDAGRPTQSAAFRQKLEALVRAGFAQRRKMLRGTLLRWLAAQGFNPSDAISLGFMPEARPQDIAVEQWCALAARLEFSPVQALRSINSTL